MTHHDKPYSMDQPGVDLLAPILLAIGAMGKNLPAETANLTGGEPFGFSSKTQFDQALTMVANDVTTVTPSASSPPRPRPACTL